MSQCFYEASASAQLSDRESRTGYWVPTVLKETWFSDVYIFLWVFYRVF